MMLSMKRWMMITVSAALLAVLLIGVAAPPASAHGPNGNGDGYRYGNTTGYGRGMGGGMMGGGHMMGRGNTPGQGYGVMGGSYQGFGQMPGWGQSAQPRPGFGQGMQHMPGYGMPQNYGYGMSNWGNNSMPGYGMGYSNPQSTLNRWWNRVNNAAFD